MDLNLFKNTKTNDFDTSKIATIINAKDKETGETETRNIIDERSISLQMNLALEFQTGGKYKFKENDFSGSEPVIYSNCPDNIIQFIETYAEKYNKFPSGNVTVLYYNGDNIEMQSQGAANISFYTADLYTETFKDFQGRYTSGIQAMIKEGKDNFSISIEDLDFHLMDSDESDLVFTSPLTVFADKESEPTTQKTGYLVFIKKETTQPDVKVGYRYFANVGSVDSGTFNTNTYYFGFISEEEKKSGQDILFSTWEANECLGEVTFEVKAADDDNYIITNMIFAPTNLGKSVSYIQGMEDELYISGYYEGGSFIKGLTVSSKHDGPASFTNSSTINNKIFEFQFTYQDNGELKPTLGMKFMKYDLERELNFSSETEGALGATTFKDVCTDELPDPSGTEEPRSDIYPYYMYLDHDLHLPDIQL